MYKSDWFADDDLSLDLGSSSNKKTSTQASSRGNSTIEKLDIDYLAQLVEEDKGYVEQISEMQSRMDELMSECEKYTNQSAKAYSSAESLRDEFTDKLKERNKSIQIKEQSVIDDLTEIEKLQRKIIIDANGAMEEISKINTENEKQKAYVEQYSEGTKQMFRELNARQHETKGQLEGYMAQIEDDQENAEATIVEYKTKVQKILNNAYLMSTKLDEWRVEFNEDASEFREKMEMTDSVISSIVEGIAQNSADIRKIKEDAQENEKNVREKINRMQGEMSNLDMMCENHKGAIQNDYKEFQQQFDQIQTRYEANKRLMEQNQQELQDLQERLTELHAEREAISRKVQSNFQEAESVCQTFAEYKRNLLNKGVAELNFLANNYNDMYNAMTGSANNVFDIIDKNQSVDGMYEQIKDVNKSIKEGNNPFEKPYTGEPERIKPAPRPAEPPRVETESEPVNPYNGYEPQRQVIRPKQPQQNYQREVITPKPAVTEPATQYIGSFEEEPAYNFNNQPDNYSKPTQPVQNYDNSTTMFGSDIDVDIMKSDYMSNFTQDMGQMDGDMMMIPDDGNGYYNDTMMMDNEYGMPSENMYNDPYSQQDNFMGTGDLLDNGGTMLFEGTNELLSGDFSVPYSQEPMMEPEVEEQPVKKKGLSGFFGRRK